MGNEPDGQQQHHDPFPCIGIYQKHNAGHDAENAGNQADNRAKPGVPFPPYRSVILPRLSLFPRYILKFNYIMFLMVCLSGMQRPCGIVVSCEKRERAENNVEEQPSGTVGW